MYSNSYNNGDSTGGGRDSYSMVVSVWDVITIQSTNYQDYGTQSAYHLCENVTVTYSGVPILLQPTEIEPIGKQTSAVIFWMINGAFKGGQFVGTSNSATTGAITLGNAVGFLNLNYNGEIFKIPFYK